MGEWPGILQVSSHNFVTIFYQLGAFINKNPEKIAFNFFLLQKSLLLPEGGVISAA
jgi:hypothetical protein